MRLRRIEQVLSGYGYCSRREAAAWLKAGRVRCGQQVLTRGDQKVAVHEVLVDDRPIDFPDGLLLLLHKPLGRVCSHEAAEGETVYGLLPPQWMARTPRPETVGRLDKDTSGLLLVTDDGQLLHRWTSPRHKVEKVYEVTLAGDTLREELVALFASGTLLLDGEEKPCLPARLECLDSTHARLTLTEGKYHQVRRMFAVCGLTVVALHRSRFGPYTLEGLAEGQWRAVEMPS